jgi:uncharacterized protein YecT (DUF1311 family)
MDQANERLIRECLGKAEASSEEKLRQEVSATVKGLDAQHSMKFHNSQEAWKLYRDTECDFEGDAYRGGTLAADQATICQIAKNNGRVEELGQDIGLAAH